MPPIKGPADICPGILAVLSLRRKRYYARVSAGLHAGRRVHL